MTAVVIIAAIVLTAAVCAWFFLGRSSENAADHRGVHERTTSEQMFGDVDDRPGDPGSEGQGVAGAGEVVPGPLRHERRRPGTP